MRMASLILGVLGGTVPLFFAKQAILFLLLLIAGGAVALLGGVAS